MRLPEDSGRPVLTTGGHYGYLKIAEGCDKHCTYCIIPSLEETSAVCRKKDSCAGGVYGRAGGKRTDSGSSGDYRIRNRPLRKENSSYPFEKTLPDQEIRWIRVLYCYPEEIYDEMIQVMKEEKKICHYLDLPIQHE